MPMPGGTPGEGDRFGSVPELPRRSERRWTIRRRAAVVEAVRGGWVPIEEVCRLYTLSVDEFLAWERDVDQFGIHGLRSTRYQIYRDTKPRLIEKSAESMTGIKTRCQCRLKRSHGVKISRPM